MSLILALDPGTTQTGWVVMQGKAVMTAGVHSNEDMLKNIQDLDRSDTTLAIEMIASYGMAVGREVFETCVWIGRFKQAWLNPDEVRLVFRRDVKLHLCKSPKAKDANVRAAIIDLFPATGGGKVPQIGTKKQPGPLFGVSTHAWPALGVAITINPEFAEHAIPSHPHQRSAPGRRAVLQLPMGPVPLARRRSKA